MKRVLFISLAVILVVAIVVPFLLGEKALQYFSSFALIVTTSCTILTAFIAILLYDRFSVEKDLLAKQLENVSRLIENTRIGGVLLKIRELDGEEKFFTAVFTGPGEATLPSLLASKEAFLDYKLVLGPAAYDKLISIMDGVTSFYLPKEIYAACKRLMVSDGGMSQDFRIACVLAFLPQKEHADFKEDSVYEIHGHTLRSFLESLNELYQTIENWLAAHDITDADVRGIDWLDPAMVKRNHSAYAITFGKKDESRAVE